MKFTVGVVAQAALLLLLLLFLNLHLLLLLLPAPALDCVARSDERIFCGPLVARARRTSLFLPPPPSWLFCYRRPVAARCSFRHIGCVCASSRCRCHPRSSSFVNLWNVDQSFIHTFADLALTANLGMFTKGTTSTFCTFAFLLPMNASCASPQRFAS